MFKKVSAFGEDMPYDEASEEVKQEVKNYIDEVKNTNNKSSFFDFWKDVEWDNGVKLTYQQMTNLLGMNEEQWNNAVETEEKNERIAEFEQDKDDDISILNRILEEESLRTFAAHDRLQNLIIKLKDLKYDGESDVGWKISDRFKTKKILG